MIEVQPTGTSGGTIVWEVGLVFDPYEAIRIENGNTLIVGAYGDDNKDGKYGPSSQTEIREIKPDKTYDNWAYSGTGSTAFVDIEEKGIINIAKILYKDEGGKEMPKVFAGVVVPIFQPEITMLGTPTIVATKTVTPTGPQRPGATLTYTILVTNTGNGTATNVRIIDQIPP